MAVDNLNWEAGKKHLVLGLKDSVTTTKSVQAIIDTQCPVSRQQSREIETSYLNVEWIYKSIDGSSKSFTDFIEMIAEAPNESLFSTEIIVSLVEYFWDDYYGQIYNKVFIPFMIYFVLTIGYFSVMVTEDMPPEQVWNFWSAEFAVRNIALIFLLYFLLYEFYQLLSNRLIYFTDVYNLFDLSSAIINVFIMFSYGYGYDWVDPDRTRQIAAVAVILMWIKAFYWMRLFGSTSYFIRMIGETFYDIRFFIFLFFTILFTFGNAMFILNYNRKLTQAQIDAMTPEELESYEEETIISEHFSLSIANIFVNQYLLALGEFEGMDFFDGEDSAAVWIFFLITTFITQITFLNMLIAIMGDSYAKVTETKDQSALVEKMKIMADYVSVVNSD